MKKWMAGIVAVTIVSFAAGSVWAEDGEGEKAQDQERKQLQERKQRHERKQRKERERKEDGENRRGEREARMAEADKDGDGKVSFDEFSAAHQERIKIMFDRIDANKDGFLDESDREAMRAQRQEAAAGEGEQKRQRGGDKKRDRDRDHKREGGDTDGSDKED